MSVVDRLAVELPADPKDHSAAEGNDRTMNRRRKTLSTEYWVVFGFLALAELTWGLLLITVERHRNVPLGVITVITGLSLLSISIGNIRLNRRSSDRTANADPD